MKAYSTSILPFFWIFFEKARRIFLYVTRIVKNELCIMLVNNVVSWDGVIFFCMLPYTIKRDRN